MESNEEKTYYSLLIAYCLLLIACCLLLIAYFIMSSEIIVNTNSWETRVALLENGVVSELYIERKKDEGIVGNVYKGRVVKILPGMQVAFVDIGLEKSGFLYV